MDAAQVTALTAEALLLALTLAAPVLLATFAVSLAASALQALTQLQDGALVLVPKLVVGLLTLWLSADWMSGRVLQFASDVLRALP